jgi:hypothetical protein
VRAFAHAALLSLVPAAAAFVMRQASELPLATNTVVATYVAFLSCILLLAAAFRVLVAIHKKPASWGACLKVAAYGATPVLVAGVALVHPALVIVPMVALLHVFYLQYVGAQVVIGIAAEDAAIFVAWAVAGVFVVSSLGGAAAAAMGLL